MLSVRKSEGGMGAVLVLWRVAKPLTGGVSECLPNCSTLYAAWGRNRGEGRIREMGRDRGKDPAFGLLLILTRARSWWQWDCVCPSTCAPLSDPISTAGPACHRGLCVSPSSVPRGLSRHLLAVNIAEGLFSHLAPSPFFFSCCSLQLGDA